MSLHTERLQLKGRLEELRKRRASLVASAGALMRAIRLGLPPLARLDEINTDEVAEAAKQLQTIQAEFRQVLEDIAAVERELR